MLQPFLELTSDPWVPIKDCNDSARVLFDRHYSRRRFKEGHISRKFVGPGENMVLMTHCARGLFVWRKFISDSGEDGVNCAIFRNETGILSSELIAEADRLADQRWPGERHYTYVNARKIKSTNPGYCFIQAGWRRCGITKHRKLIILEKPYG
jgi:hypothetical protein